MRIFQIFFLNFWVWWYVVKGGGMLRNVWRSWLYAFELLRIGPMLGNLFQPFFQDRSWTGRIIAFPVRFIWGTIGLVIQIIFSIVLIGGLIIYFVLPVLLVFLIIKTIFLILI